MQQVVDSHSIQQESSFEYSENLAFGTYLNLIRRWNPSCSLVSTGDIPHLVERHILDSLALLPYLGSSKNHLDIGSGGGFPGIPIAISRPDLRVVVNDRSHKKCRFLRTVKFELQLENVEVWESDVSSKTPHTELFDTVSIRAVAPPATSWTLAEPLLEEEGRVLLQTAEVIQENRVSGSFLSSERSSGRGWITVIARLLSQS